MSMMEPHPEQLKYIFDNAKVGIVVCDAKNHRIEMANPAFARMHGYEVKELIGKVIEDVFDLGCIRQFESLEDAPSCQNDTVTFETLNFKKDGTSVPVAIHVTMIADEKKHVEHYVANVVDISEKKISDRLVRLLTHAINTSSESVFLIRVDYPLFLYVNDTAARRLGYSKQELTEQMGVFDIDPDFNDMNQWVEHVKELKRRGGRTFETRHCSKNGQIYPVEIRSNFFQYEGERYILSISRDITDKITFEKALIDREREFRSLAENSPDVIIRYDLEGRRLYINPMGIKLFGHASDDIIGKTPAEYSPIPAEVLFMEKFHDVIQTGNAIEIETEFTIPTGGKGWGHIRVVPEFNECAEVISVLTIGRDITERKRQEELLKQKEMRLKEAQKIAKLGSWELVFPTMELTWSEEIYRIFEISHEQSPPCYDSFLDIVHPKDRLLVDTLYRESVKQKTPYEVVHRLLFADGRVKYVHEKGTTHYDTDGNPIRSIGTVQDITEQKMIEKKIEHIAHHDVLTGLPNRMLAKDRTEQAIIFAKRNAIRCALLFIDLDGFKTINDTLGHSVGDTVLKIIASRLKECVRESDTVARQGGDEFLLILSDFRGREDIKTIVEKILYTLDQSLEVGMHILTSSASIGIAVYPEHGDTFELLLQNADTAMYKAKENGKNTYCFFTQQMNQTLIGQFKIQSDLKSAIRNGEFVLHYQPQIDLKTNRIVGVEALIRWQHAQLGTVPPMHFIPVAESNGLIIPIGEWVIQEACSQLACWKEKGIAVSVAVNISSVQFKRGNLESVVKNAIASAGIEPKCLELELTESIIMHETDAVLQTVRNLKALGLKLSIDDFGTGYSSLAYLKRFAVDKLKIDQSFVRGILNDQEDAVIVSTIIQMAKSLSLKTIAEGVENERVLSLINHFGCDEVQGYHFAAPMEAHQFEEYYGSFAPD